MDKLRETKLRKLKASKKPQNITVDVKELSETVSDLKDYLSGLEEHRVKEANNLVAVLSELQAVVGKVLDNDKTEAIAKAIEKVSIKQTIQPPKIVIPKQDAPRPHIKVVNANEDVFATYKPSDTDLSDTVSYFGFISKTGAWFIMRQSGSESASFRYVFGVKEYAEAWNIREQLSYGRFNES